MKFSKRKSAKNYKKSIVKKSHLDNVERTLITTAKPEIDSFVIERGLPVPLRKVSYTVLLRIIETLKQLTPGDSFPIQKELMYPVKKMSNSYFPEYKIRILQTGDSYRVFRRA